MATGGGLTAKDHAAVDEFMDNEEDRPGLSALELVEESATADLSETCLALARRFPTWTPEQLRTLALFDNSDLRPPDSIRRGVARRFALEAPSELATYLAVGARVEWLNVGHARETPAPEPERHFLPILQAVAANDFEAAHRFARSALTRPAVTPTVKEYVPAFQGVLALLLADAAELGRAVAAMDRCKPKAYVAAIYDVLRGAASRSPTTVAAGLNGMLKAYPKYMFSDPVTRLVDPHAHGLYTLCQRFSEDLVAEFDVGRPLPWDAEYHAWQLTADAPLKGADLTSISPEVHQCLIELRRPNWWDAEGPSAW